MAAKLTFVEEVRTTQPLGHVGINRNNRLGAKVFDAWNAPTLMMQSAMGRRPIVKPSSIGLTPGKFGIGAYGTSGSVRYDIGEHGEYGTHSFVAIVSTFSYTSSCSVVRKDGAYIPVQVANLHVRGVPWDPVDGGLNYVALNPSWTNHSVFIFNRVSQSTVNLIANGVQVASKTNLTGYGSTTNPLCFLGTESNEELFTINDGLFFCGIAFKEPLSSSDIVDITNNPWQIFEPEEIPLFKPTVTAQYARPISDVSAGGWTASTGSDLFAMLDETSANDSDYITSTTASTCEVALGSLSDPALSTGHIVRYRISATGGGIIVRLRQGTTTIATWTHDPAPASLTTYSQTLSSGEADSITDYANLRYQFEAIP